MESLNFALLLRVALMPITITKCNSLENEITTPGEWGDWFGKAEGWSDQQWSPIIGLECKTAFCGRLRLQAYTGGIMQGSLRSDHTYDSSYMTYPSTPKMECKTDHIVTRLWVDNSGFKLRCTKLDKLKICTEATCGATYRYLTETIRDDKVEARTCKPGTVMVGMECSGNACHHLKLLCDAVTPPIRFVSSWWEPYQVSGGNTKDTFTVTQSSEETSEKIFRKTTTWSIGLEFGGAFKVPSGSLSFKMTASYQKETFEQLKTTYTKTLTSEHEKICEPRCAEQKKNGFLWMTRVELMTDSNISLPQVSSPTDFFQAPPACLVQCVSTGKVPQCPVQYCADDDCQYCTEDTKYVLEGDFPMSSIVSASVQHHCPLLLLFFVPAILAGTAWSEYF
jgi:hypothetical protein